MADWRSGLPECGAVPSTIPDATVMVAGLGDLGARVLDALARRPGIGRLVVTARDLERGRAQLGQAALVAQLAGGPSHTEIAALDLDDVAATAAVLERVDPDVVVMAASSHSWWRVPGGESGRTAPALPYATWLPLQMPLVRRLMQAHRAASSRARVVCLPYPDAIGPVLAAEGLAPDVGAGNVAEVAAKLSVLAAADGGRATARLVLHHAAERIALGAFAPVGPAAPEPGEPPWAAEVVVDERELEPAKVAALLRAPYPLPPGRETHALTAASAVAIVEGLLSETSCAAHVPAPGGRPGGYPVLLSRAGVAMDLPRGMSEADAMAINARAARWDGIEAIAADGTVILTERAAAAIHGGLGLELRRIAPGDYEALATELRARVAARDSPRERCA